MNPIGMYLVYSKQMRYMLLMNGTCMLPLLLMWAIANQNFGPAAVWKPGADFRQSVITACENRGREFDECFADRMKAAGASAEAVAFTHAIHNGGYMQGIRLVGPIAVASVIYPFRANENSGLLIVNGKPLMIDVDALNSLPADRMSADTMYQAMLKEHSDATLWPGDRSSTNSLLALMFDDGSYELVAGYRVQAGCHACAVLGQAFFGFEFDRDGKMTSTKFNGFTPDFSGDRSVSEKVVRVAPNSLFTVLLPANRTTGYSWALAHSEAKSELTLLHHDYQSAGNLVGGGGEERWSFRAPSAGDLKLNFSYARPWEKNTAPAESLALSIRVQK